MHMNGPGWDFVLHNSANAGKDESTKSVAITKTRGDKWHAS
jgi:hypothetical protein